MNSARRPTLGNGKGASTMARLARSTAARAALCTLLIATSGAYAHAQSITPTRVNVAALPVFEHEAEAFLRRGHAFRSDVDAMLNRRHERQIAEIRTRFGRQRDFERDAESSARRSAIDVLERFLRLYPDDREHTPDVMFRLAELYYDDAAIAHLDADVASLDSAGAASRPDYRCPIALYREIERRFSDYRHVDATLHLLGYVLREMGAEDESQSAELAMVCTGRAPYTAQMDLDGSHATISAPSRCAGLMQWLRSQRPSPPGEIPNVPVTPIPYDGCVARRGADGGPSRYAAEAWYQIGDYHFDHAVGSTDVNHERALAAYESSMRASIRPGTTAADAGPYWQRALYKIGWTWFRREHGAGRAFDAFARLMDHVDTRGFRNDPIERGMRQDTLRWIGILLTEHDPEWVSGESRDCQSTVVSLAAPPPDVPRPFSCAGLARIPARIPDARSWAADAWLALADAWFDQTRYFESVAAYRAYVSRFPQHLEVPRAMGRMATAYDRVRQFDRGLAIRRETATVVARWAPAHRDEPAAVRAGERLARDGLHDAAVRRHSDARAARELASQLRACIDGRDAPGVCAPPQGAVDRARLESRASESLRASDAAYLDAAAAYREFVVRYVHDDAVDEMRFNLGSALFWARHYEEAGGVFDRLRDDDDDRFRASSAWMAVRSREAEAQDAALRDRSLACELVRAGVASAEDARCTSVTHSAMPDAVARIVAARDAYVARLQPGMDTRAALADVLDARPAIGVTGPPYAPWFAILNARTAARYGQFVDSERRLRRVLASACDDDGTVARAAFTELHNLLVSLHRTADIVALAHEQANRRCRGVSRTDLDPIFADEAFRAASSHRTAALALGGEARDRALRDAGQELLDVADGHPHHAEVPDAMLLAANAFEQAGLPARAQHTYARVIETVSARTALRDPRVGSRASDAQPLPDLVAEAQIGIGRSLERTLEFDDAVRAYQRVVAASPLEAPGATWAARDRERRHDALEAIAWIQTHLARADEAAEAWRAVVGVARDEAERAHADFERVFVLRRGSDAARALERLRAYRRSAATDALHVDYLLRVQAVVAQLAAQSETPESAGRERATLEAFWQAHPSQPGSAAARDVAEALLPGLVDRVRAMRESPWRSTPANELARLVRERTVALAAVDDEARRILEMRGGEASASAIVLRAEAHEDMATQLVRVGSLIAPSESQARAAAGALRRADALDRQAASLERRRPEITGRLRAVAQQVRDAIDAAHAQAVASVQTVYDRESLTHRLLAIQDYAIGGLLARRNGYASRPFQHARERLGDEENRAHLDEALARISPAVLQAVGATLRDFTLIVAAPGAVIADTSAPIRTPALATDPRSAVREN